MQKENFAPRVLLSATGSGNGKTMVTMALLGALRKKGLEVQSYKCGPDYIDPMFHSRVTGRKTYQIDPFFSDTEFLKRLVGEKSATADISIVEGAMGYYDGIGKSCEASAYMVSQCLEIPTILLLSPQGKGCSLAAECTGFLRFRMPNMIQGVIFNRLKKGMYNYYREIVECETGLQVLGYIPELQDVHFESRHLGLITVGEVQKLNEKLQKLTNAALECMDIDGIIALSKRAPNICYTLPKPRKHVPYRLGIARDEAFCFYYAENLELMQEYGAEIVEFSPLHDRNLPDSLDGLYFGGGYPELYAPALSANTGFIESLQAISKKGIPIFAECGGFMYIQEFLEDHYGNRYSMAHLLPGSTKLGDKLCRFGYVTIEAKEDTIIGKKGTQICGHEFHYADSTCNGKSFKAVKPSGISWEAIQHNSHIVAGFPHVYFPSNPKAVEQFSLSCVEYQKRKKRK